MKKKLIIIVVTVVLITATIGGLYLFSGLETVEVQTHSYLLDKGYANADINTINVNFSPMNFKLSYLGWTSTVVFTDEPNVKYHFVFADGKILSNGVSAKGSEPQKLKQFE